MCIRPKLIGTGCSVWTATSSVSYTLWHKQLLLKLSIYVKILTHVEKKLQSATFTQNVLAVHQLLCTSCMLVILRRLVKLMYYCYSTVRWHYSFLVSYDKNGHRLVSNIVQLRSGLSVETLQTPHLRQHHPNVSISEMRQKQSGRRVLLPAAFRQSLTADSNQSNN